MGFQRIQAFSPKTLQKLDFKERFDQTHFSTSDGERFSWQIWIPSMKNPRAIVIAVHGNGAAASEFTSLGEFLLQEKIAVYAPNLRGQGLDPIIKRRGRELNVEQLLLDIRAVVIGVQQKYPRVPIFLYGESMGALLVIRFLSNEQMLLIKGAILAVPVVELAKPISPIVRKIIKLAAIYFPSLRISPQYFKKISCYV